MWQSAANKINHEIFNHCTTSCHESSSTVYVNTDDVKQTRLSKTKPILLSVAELEQIDAQFDQHGLIVPCAKDKSWQSKSLMTLGWEDEDLTTASPVSWNFDDDNLEKVLEKSPRKRKIYPHTRSSDPDTRVQAERNPMTSKCVCHEKTLTSESECSCKESIASEDHLAFEIL